MNNIKFRESKTHQLLINGFACKSQTACKYFMYSEIALKEGYEQISRIFEQTAKHEITHAKLFFNSLENEPHGIIDCEYSYKTGSTEENLLYAIAAEEHTCQSVYANGEETALSEGFDAIASIFKHVRNAQFHHAQRFKILYENIKNKTVFSKETQEKWFCTNCGYVYEDKSAPNYCPNCYALKSVFEILCEKY